MKKSNIESKGANTVVKETRNNNVITSLMTHVEKDE
jgi:hypothetical protein